MKYSQASRVSSGGIRAACTAMAIATLSACKEDEVRTNPESTDPVASAVPVDHLADGELLEGSERAFDLPLPRGMTVDGRFVAVGYASGEIPPQPLATYLRPRVPD